MTLDAETMQRIMVEVDLGIPPAESKVPPGPAVDAFRAKMVVEIGEMKAKGGMLYFTPETIEPGYATPEEMARTRKALGWPEPEG